MNAVRRGKIARLPHPVREQLNTRMLNGERGNKLVNWLNALPEVQTVLTEEFRGRPVVAQNLTEWRQGGYRDWLAERQMKDAADRLGHQALAGETQGLESVVDTLASWVAGCYAMHTQRLLAIEGEESWRMLRQMTDDVVALRRGEHRAQRMELDRERREAGSLRGWKRQAQACLEELFENFAENLEQGAPQDDLVGKDRPTSPSSKNQA